MCFKKLKKNKKPSGKHVILAQELLDTRNNTHFGVLETELRDNTNNPALVEGRETINKRSVEQRTGAGTS